MQAAGPPPPYTLHKPPTQGPYPPPHPFNGSHAIGPFVSPPRSPYGPTPIGAGGGVGILPYYNPEALHADELLEEASRRARWRFIEAFLWALFLWCLLGAMTSATVMEVRRQ
ncbi:unnamed protein product [Rhizoctonia solani]|uniref:Transmembrane protein n=1 Tax=Rhizoctonia solani TaxID=456999 RepID=A0A8H3D534_9AGAM|nr:unnamed protein product [Rhizoctonia solani]